MNRLPAIISDIDGVLLRGRNKVINADLAISQWKQHNYPFYCLTNGGGVLEHQKASQLNNYLDLQPQYQIQSNEVVLNFSPLRKVINQSMDAFNNLVLGVGTIRDMADDCGMQLYLTQLEYGTIFEEQGIIRSDIHHFKQEIIERVEKRFNLNIDEVKRRFNTIDNLFIFNDPDYQEQILQILLAIRHKQSQTVNVYMTNTDIVFVHKIELPRFAGFALLRRWIHDILNTNQINLIQYGKPTLATYEYTTQLVDQNNSIDTFYMIGDNLESDIRGANNMKQKDKRWKSVLVETGVYSQSTHQIEDDNQPDYIFPNIHEAVQHILKQHSIN